MLFPASLLSDLPFSAICLSQKMIKSLDRYYSSLSFAVVWTVQEEKFSCLCICQCFFWKKNKPTNQLPIPPKNKPWNKQRQTNPKTFELQNVQNFLKSSLVLLHLEWWGTWLKIQKFLAKLNETQLGILRKWSRKFQTCQYASHTVLKIPFDISLPVPTLYNTEHCHCGFTAATWKLTLKWRWQTFKESIQTGSCLKNMCFLIQAAPRPLEIHFSLFYCA